MDIFGMEIMPYNSSPTKYKSYIVKRTKIVNVLLVGRSGVGKTTIIDTLINEKTFVEAPEGFSKTREPNCHRCVVYTDDGTLYQLNILDTPGLQENSKDPTNNRSDDAILDLAARCVKENVTFLNAVCFVSVAGKTFEQDVDTFKRLKEFLGGAFTHNAMIILTHCDQIPDSRFAKYVEDLSQLAQTKDVYDFCKLGVFKYGAVNKDNFEDFDEEFKEKAIIARQKKTAVMRNELIEAFIALADKPVVVDELEQLRKQYFSELLKKISDLIKKKMACSIM